jgi:hypothetical protein
VPALEAGLLGASVRFKVQLEELDTGARASSYNPDALPERTIRKAQLYGSRP